MISIRFFGSNSCINCIEVSKLIIESGLRVDYIDAMSPKEEIQDFCDTHNVDDLPHLQFLYEGDEVIFEHTGEVNDSLKNLITYFKTKNTL